MKVAILGYGAQGQSAYNYWSLLTDDVTICDANTSLEVPPNAKTQLGRFYLHNLDQFDILVRSPSVHPRDIVENNLDHPSILGGVTSNTNEFMRICPTRNIVGVTGTKGKGTTSTLIAKMLEATGQKVHLGGNIGTPPLELLRNHIQPDDWVVLELANFQLIDLKYSPALAVCLMVVPEHQDWHTDVAEYVTAKQQLFRWQTMDDFAVYYADNHLSREVVATSSAQKIPYFQAPGAVVRDGNIVIDGQAICATKDIKLLGEHNWQNACAAATLMWQLTHNVEALSSVLTSFSGLEHRLEMVREISGVKFYDDSFGTTPETAIVAMQAIKQPKVMILGGSDKGVKYTELAEAVVKNNVKHVLTIGNTGPVIAQELRLLNYHNVSEGGETMQQMVHRAQQHAAEGDAVVLSPACASFGLFASYKDRGEKFKAAVGNLSAALPLDQPGEQPAGDATPADPPAPDAPGPR